MLSGIIIPVFIIGGLGLFFGVVLTYASKKFEIQRDEKVNSVREALPGANCGACSYTGCDAYAEALVNGKAKVDACLIGAQSLADKLSEILGVEKVITQRKVARVMCSGSCDKTSLKYNYSGIEDCQAASILFGGPFSCNYGCIGLGNCIKACDYGAISIKDGLARVDENKCKACGKCVITCPKNIIEIVPEDSRHVVNCSNLDKGNVVIKTCKIGCIGCGKCAKTCKFNAIEMKNNLAKINTQLCTNCGECIKVCPTQAIKRV